MEKYIVKPLKNTKDIFVQVPGSKSITNRALLLAALGKCKCTLRNVLFSDDSRTFISCLEELGFEMNVDENGKTVVVNGTNGVIPNKNATINVNSAGTAARFLTVMLSVCGGTYTLNSSEQMKRRPMAELIFALRNCGVKIECLEQEGHFPFVIKSAGITGENISIDTTTSSQYASAILMSASFCKKGSISLELTGNRTEGSYIKITTAMMKQFGISYSAEGNKYTIKAGEHGINEYDIEPDASAACYFYAMAPILKKKVIVSGLYEKSLQGDMKFVTVLKELGCEISQNNDGILVDGSKMNDYYGIRVNMKDFSDQTMTMAVVALFAKTETIIEDIGHIRLQESDRVVAVVNELNRMGIEASYFEEDGKTNIKIVPGKIKPAEIETYNDHRIAMAFTLPGLAEEGITILNPMCCKKTFENYFDVIESLY